jgi:hypothetical protein
VAGGIGILTSKLVGGQNFGCYILAPKQVLSKNSCPCFGTQPSAIQKFLRMFWHPTKCYPKILAHVLANKFGMPMIWPAHVLVGQILATNQSGPYFLGNFS